MWNDSMEAQHSLSSGSSLGRWCKDTPGHWGQGRSPWTCREACWVPWQMGMREEAAAHWATQHHTMGLREINREEHKNKEEELEIFLQAWERPNSCHLLCSCGGEHGSEPESGGESGNWLCLGIKKKFLISSGTRYRRQQQQMLKASGEGPPGYWKGSSASIAHHVCCPFLQEQCHLHFIRPSPVALCREGTPNPHPFSPKPPLHNLLISILLPMSRSSVASRHIGDSQQIALTRDLSPILSKLMVKNLWLLHRY